MDDDLAGVAAILLVVALFVGFLVWIQARARNTERQWVLDRQKMLLDRLSSGSELTEFLASPEGARFVDQLKEFGHTKSSIERTIIGTIVAGVVLVCAGIALTLTFNMQPDAEDYWDYWELLATGMLGIFAGAGLLIASGLTFLLSKKWGSFDKD